MQTEPEPLLCVDVINVAVVLDPVFTGTACWFRTGTGLGSAFDVFSNAFCVCAQSGQQRELTQIQYLAWPDHGVPDDSTDFLDFVALVRSKRAGQDQPVVVHCRLA